MAYQDEWKKGIPGHEPVRALHEALRAEIGLRWKRSLPFADELFDRWERAEHLGFGAGASVYDACIVLGDVRVGEQTWVGPFTILDGTGGLTIGRHCDVAAGVQIYTHDTVARTLSGGAAPVTYAPVAIGDCTYLGPSSIITKGVTIGSRCVIGAGSLINRDLPDNSIAFGTPARVVGRVEVDGEAVRLIYG